MAETLNLNDWCAQELDRAFDLVDLDGNGSIDDEEILSLLEDVYVSTFGGQIEQERNNFFNGFGKGSSDGLTKDQFVARLQALQQDVEGERKAFGLSRGLGLQKLSTTEMKMNFNNCLKLPTWLFTGEKLKRRGLNSSRLSRKMMNMISGN
jgi:hypothetical protein